ncbi:MAG TPA: hypothetical protein VFC07_14330, partial [Verrucomicrobiae bacterium]|nr:hypothetical protein [Verrucomicrobiae bacterium]
AAQTSLACSLTGAANNLAVGTYTANLTFSNWTSHASQVILFTLQVSQPLVVAPANGFTASGPVGGTFSVTAQNYTLTNQGGSSVPWSIHNIPSWLSASPSSGTLAAGAQTPMVISLTAAANSLAAGIYTANVIVTNPAGVAASLPFSISVAQSIVSNGGFETGDFSFWNLNANGYNIVDNGSASSLTPHSGTYLAALGQATTLGYLSQTLPTAANQPYLLSLWLDSPDGRTPNQFQVSWNGTTLFNRTNLGVLGWTNLQYLVVATSGSTVLQFAFRDDPKFLGLDDVTVTPVSPPKFTSLTRTNTTVHLTWKTVAGLSYQLQYRTNLVQTNWINLGASIPATNSTLTATDASATSSKRFYRLQLLP